MSAVATAEPEVPASASSGSSHLAGLDGLRGVAVALVVIYHAFPARLPGGFIGVDVFFVLSGFLITTLLLREKTGPDHRVRLGRFWVRRVRRLVPALIVMIALTTAATVWVGRDTDASLRSQVVGALTWTSNWIQIHQGWSYSDSHLPPLFNHLWSLGIEEQFYVLWPLMFLAGIALVGRRRFGHTTATLAVISAGLMAALFLYGDATRAYMGLDSHSFGLLLGAALALSTAPHLLTGDATDPVPLPRRSTVLGALGLLGILAFAALVEWSSDLTFLGGLGLANLAAVAVVYAAANRSAVATALGWAPLRWLGERSYGLYLWHWPLIVFGVRLAPPEHGEVASGAAVLLALVAAMISYRYLETPMRRDGIGATFVGWGVVLRDRTARGSKRVHLVATAACMTLFFATVALWQAPAESEVDEILRAGQEVVVGSVDDIKTVPGAIEEQKEASRACREVPGDVPLSAFGDSVTVAIAPALLQRRPGTTAVAAVGWQYTDVARAVREAAAAGQLHPTVLIVTGTNGLIDAADLDALVTHELAGHQVGLVAPYVPGHSWSDQSLAAVHQVAAAHDYVHLIDWNAVASQRPELTVSDRVHPTVPGQQAFADLIGQSLGTC
ncbi:MAG: acyltransferase family protein [Aeromicrobium sp.]|uniref:acyltransferase family protein n=1 Tax=Aeromicrobium sp. TaxID=1871063 RepID=UPI0039E6D0B6